MKIISKIPTDDTFDVEVTRSNGETLTVSGYYYVKSLLPDHIISYHVSVCKNSDEAEEASDNETESTLAEAEAGEDTLESFSDIEIIPDMEYGHFGFKNSAGEVVIEPQYRWVWEFSHGLCPVNLGKTHYRAENGEEYTEDHYGYIDTRGKTAIPFRFSQAGVFSKYGVAPVMDDSGYYMIDLDGNEIPGTRFPYVELTLFPSDRYITFSVENTADDDTYNCCGLYDTKERQVICEPKYSSFSEKTENDICVTEDIPGLLGDCRQWLVDCRGAIKYPWQVGKGLATVEIPDDLGYSIVGVMRFRETVETAENSIFCFDQDGKTYERRIWFGVMDKNGDMVVPTEYVHIKRLAERLYFCQRKDEIEIVEI